MPTENTLVAPKAGRLPGTNRQEKAQPAGGNAPAEDQPSTVTVDAAPAAESPVPAAAVPVRGRRTARAGKVTASAVKARPATKVAAKPAGKTPAKRRAKVAVSESAPMVVESASKPVVAPKGKVKSKKPAGAVAAVVAKVAKKRSDKSLKRGQAKPVAPAASGGAVVSVHVKVVRDGFSMPKNEYENIKSLKSACLSKGVAVKKSELLRAGLKALSGMSIDGLLAAVASLPVIKAGRRKKG